MSLHSEVITLETSSGETFPHTITVTIGSRRKVYISQDEVAKMYNHVARKASTERR